MVLDTSELEFVDGGICASGDFYAAGAHCGLRKNKEKPDLALVYSETLCNAAAVYTQNKVKGAPLLVTKANLADGKAQCIIVNSGNANTCNADGEEKAKKMCELAAKAVSVSPKDVIVASTGIIGQILPIEPIERTLPSLAKSLSPMGNSDAAAAILTTDTHKKEFAVSFNLGGKICTLGGMSKGSGMIHPNMATMLCFMTTNVNICTPLLQKALSDVTNDTFNMVSVDGDTSTNDMAVILASGNAQNNIITDESSKDYILFKKALFVIMTSLSKEIARDGEGATKLLECNVTGAATVKSAKIIAKSVITSNLFKSAMFGQDPNWGRILCAVGYAECDVNTAKVNVALSSSSGEVCVCKNGGGVDFNLNLAANILADDEITIDISLEDGIGSATAWGCDLTYDYVKINADYHT